MTRLPHENRNVRGTEPRDDFPTPKLEEVCSHPYCNVRGRENLEKHELWPRSFLRGQPIEWVQLWDGTIVGNQVYLCNAFQKEHHRMVTENEAEISWIGTKFVWQEDDFAAPVKPQPPLERAEKAPNAKHPLYGEREGSGALNISQGLTERSKHPLWKLDAETGKATLLELVPIPGEPCPTCARRVPKEEKKKEPAKKRQTLSIRCPKEREEDGVELLTDMLAQGEEILRPGEKARPMYFTLADMLGLFLLNHEEIL